MSLETQARSVDLEAGRLVVVWADEHVSRFELVELRRKCTCAQCRELRARGEAVWPKPGVPESLEVMDAALAGGWGLSLRWNDRHETGIYPWEELRAWCGCEVCTRS
jgi:DUF971 family protein